MMDEITAFYGLLVIFGGVATIQLKFFTESTLGRKVQKLKEKCDNTIKIELMKWVSEVYNAGKVTENTWEKLMTIIALYNKVKEYDAKVNNYQHNAGYGLFSSLLTALFAVLINKRVNEILQPCMFKESKL